MKKLSKYERWDLALDQYESMKCLLSTLKHRSASGDYSQAYRLKARRVASKCAARMVRYADYCNEIAPAAYKRKA